MESFGTRAVLGQGMLRNKGSFGTRAVSDQAMNRNKGCERRKMVQAMWYKERQYKGNLRTSNESEQGMRDKERGTSNVVQGMKVQGQFENKASF